MERKVGPLFLWNLEPSDDFAIDAGGIGEDIVRRELNLRVERTTTVAGITIVATTGN